MKPEQEVRRLLRRSSRFNHQVPNSSSQLDVKQITEHQNQFVFLWSSCKDVSVRQSTFLKGESAERGGAESWGEEGQFDGSDETQRITRARTSCKKSQRKDWAVFPSESSHFVLSFALRLSALSLLSKLKNNIWINVVIWHPVNQNEFCSEPCSHIVSCFMLYPLGTIKMYRTELH